MAKLKTVYTCSMCGYQAPKWLGKCPDCEQWNTFYEEAQMRPVKARYREQAENHPLPLSAITTAPEDRTSTGIGEFDRVLGGGTVQGAVVLIGGDPGIGKSTLVLQALSRLALQGLSVLYVSGEESLKQLRMRAERLGSVPDNLTVLAETALDCILDEIKRCRPALVAVDSVQTIHAADIESAPGSVSQIRETSARLIEYAKQTDTACFLVGHVTKEGAIAGPKVLEHMVDTVLYFEGDRSHSYRILRAVKNRFGSTDEIGVFEMGSAGLIEVANPSELFIAERPEKSPGSTVVSSIEGTRPLLVEIQALVAPTSLALPRRTAIGIDHGRASVLVAVLEKRMGMTLYNQDVFLNIAGGVRLSEPGIDLGVITSIVSSTLDRPLPPHTAVCGEVGLTGEVRAVGQIVPRIREAARLGFAECIIPKKNCKSILSAESISIVGVETVREAVDHIFKGRSCKAL